MELLERLKRVSAKSGAENWGAVCFFSRRGLAAIPFLPVPWRLRVSDAETPALWWSYVPAIYDAAKGTFDYRGPDAEYLRFLWRVLRPGMCFFDIGAYHGLYGLVAAKKMAGNGRVVMFEPSPRGRARIRIHLLLNRVKAAVESLALSSKRGPSEFFLVLSGYTTMSGLNRPPADYPVQKIFVETATLDDYCSENGLRQVDVVKIDVEGGEMEVFKGARRLLAETRPLLICEVLDWVTRPWGYEARDLISYLEERGYEWFDFTADGRIMPHAKRGAYPEIRNYLAVPREKRDLVENLIAA